MKHWLSENDCILLIQWVQENLGVVIPLDWYNPTYEELLHHRSTIQGAVIVFGGGSKNTIFHGYPHLGDAVIHAYRAWHDSVHIANNLDFSQASENQLAWLLRYAAIDMGLSAEGAELIKLDLLLHIQHYYHHKQHPEDQIALVAEAVRNMQVHRCPLQLAVRLAVQHKLHGW